MGKRGPAPTPTALANLRGNPGRRPKNKAEPMPKRGRVPRPPAHLSPGAVAEWKRLAKRLHQCGVLSEIDHDALAVYCTLYARWKEAERIVQERGEIVKMPDGEVKQNPYLRVANVARTDALLLMREFGMTPASRSRIIALPEPHDAAGELANEFFGG